MKKRLYTIFSVVVVLAMVFAGSAFADGSYSYDNVVIIGSYMGSEGDSPACQAVKVVLSAGQTEDVAVGDVLDWDLVAGDGYHVRVSSADVLTSRFAGVAITIMHSPDDGTQAKRTVKSYGYMAVRGFCKANCITGGSVSGENLQLNGSYNRGTFTTSGFDNSSDIGVLLYNTSATGLMPIWLR